MKKVILGLCFTIVVAFVMTAVFAVSPGMLAAEDVPAAYKQADLKLGGLLYDKWYKIAGAEVSGNHPLYPMDGKKSGGDTWRCKECHGWDYIGKEGRYKKGSHYTGIDGVYGARNKSPDELFKAITSGSHGIKELTASSENVWALVKFIREGLIDINTALNTDGKPVGDAASGKTLYGSGCSACHGADGNKIDFNKDKDGPQGVGWLANDNPQETLHKIRWGHPGSKMPSTVADKGLSDPDTVNLLTYSQTL
ncbi:MAG: c-type cytochrome [bacterium]|nr:c-type cytochrome [bacterium]